MYLFVLFLFSYFYDLCFYVLASYCVLAFRHIQYEVHDDVAVLRMNTPNEKVNNV